MFIPTDGNSYFLDGCEFKNENLNNRMKLFLINIVMNGQLCKIFHKKGGCINGSISIINYLCDSMLADSFDKRNC